MRFLLILCIFFLTVFNHVNADSEFIYPDNKIKKIMSAEKFYSSKNLQYSELDNATMNIRKKLIYKDLEKVIKKEVKGDKILFINLRNIYMSKNPNISPNRQVYLFCSIRTTNKLFENKFIIIDGETSEPILEGYRKANSSN